MNLHYVLVLTTQRESKVHHFFSLKPSNLTTQSEVPSHSHIQYLYMLVFIIFTLLDPILFKLYIYKWTLQNVPANYSLALHGKKTTAVNPAEFHCWHLTSPAAIYMIMNGHHLSWCFKSACYASLS